MHFIALITCFHFHVPYSPYMHQTKIYTQAYVDLHDSAYVDLQIYTIQLIRFICIITPYGRFLF